MPQFHLALGELHLKRIPDVDPSIPFLYWKNIELPQQVTPKAAEQAERHLNEAVSVGQEGEYAWHCGAMRYTPSPC